MAREQRVERQPHVDPVMPGQLPYPEARAGGFDGRIHGRELLRREQIRLRTHQGQYLNAAIKPPRGEAAEHRNVDVAFKVRSRRLAPIGPFRSHSPAFLLVVPFDNPNYIVVAARQTEVPADGDAAHEFAMIKDARLVRLAVHPHLDLGAADIGDLPNQEKVTAHLATHLSTSVSSPNPISLSFLGTRR